MEQQAREYVSFARQLSGSESYSKAFEFYLMAFDKDLSLRNVLLPEFGSVLNALNETLASANKINEIFNNFQRTLEVYPNNVTFLNDIGKYLFHYGFYDEAMFHFQKALNLDSEFVNAEKNLNSLKNLLVERWHFRMLNDKIRNEAYRAAIHQSLVPVKDCVLDLGTGTGLLAMYANECKPMAITACDGSEVMTKLAEVITQDNGYDDIIIVNKLSTTMNYRDVGGKRSLLITEMFDAALFGEHVLQSLSHAWEYLISSAGRVIPNKAEFFIIGAKSDFLCQKYQLNASVKTILNISTLNVHVMMNGETYDCEDVHLYGEDIKYMTEAASVVKINFNDPHEIQDAINRTEPYEVELKVIENGEIDVYIGYFNLYLTDTITVTTDPRSNARANAWQQAIFFDNIPKQVEENDIIDAEFLMNGGKLTMLKEYDYSISRISSDILWFLNDVEFMNMILRCIGTACVYLGQMAEISQINVIDLCPFPMFGLQLLKRGIQSLICSAKTECDRQFFKKVFKANDIPLSKVTILVGDDWLQDVFKDEKYHAIFCNFFEQCGEIDIRAREIAKQLKTRHLHQGGLFMPANIKLMGQIVKSHWLDINNRVFDVNVSHYRIAEYLNKFEVTQNYDLDFSHLEYTPLSNPCVLGSLSTIDQTEIVSVPVLRDGHASAILCWYIIELMDNSNEISTNRKSSYIRGVSFAANAVMPLRKDSVTDLSCCFDSNGCFKVIKSDIF